MNDLPKFTRVARRTVENSFDVTLHLDIDLAFQPGQFAMVWLPGVNEKPFSIAGRDSDGVFITVRRRGPFSSLLADLREGDPVGIRGPLGKGFNLRGRPLLIAGGVGMAAVAPIAAAYPSAPILYGENDAAHRMYRERYPDAMFFTADGSEGRKGYPTAALAETVERYGCDVVYSCGPEPMLVKAIEFCEARNLPMQAAIERYMKCGRGLCGQCSIGGDRVCADGPVFDRERLALDADFGRRQLDASGQWQYLQPESAGEPCGCRR